MNPAPSCQARSELTHRLATLAVVFCLTLAGCGGGQSNRLSMVAVEPLQPARPLDASHPAPPSPEPSEPIGLPAEIVTSFYSSKLDHYPLDATRTRPVKPEAPVRPEEPDQPVRPERPQRPVFDQEAYRVEGRAYLDAYQAMLAAQEAEYQAALDEHYRLLSVLEVLYAVALADYEAAMQWYEVVLAEFEIQLTQYNAGQCCWVMVERDSDVASGADVLAMLRENAFSLTVPGEATGISRDIFGHASPPVVRIYSGAAPEARAAALRAMDNINAWLPWDKHLVLGGDLYSDPAALMDAEIELGLKADEYHKLVDEGAPDTEVEEAYAAYSAASDAVQALIPSGKRHIGRPGGGPRRWRVRLI